MFFTDKATIGSLRKTEDGYTVAVARAVRTGVQQYHATELGFMEDEVINVYRAPEDVFHADSLQSFSHAPVTIGHPREHVTADNWSDLAVGEVSTAATKDGDWVALPLILKDKAATEQPWRELSAGYTCELVAEDGVAPDGTPYSHKQTNIRINHLALVDKARAGSKARLGDEDHKWGVSPITKEVPQMELKTVVLGDEAVQVVATDASKFDAYKAASAQALADSEEKVGELTAKLADAESKVVSDADIEKRVADRVALVSAAKAVVAELVADGKSDAEIRKEVVVAKFGDEAVKDLSDAAIVGMFKAATLAKDSDETMRQTLSDKSQVKDYDAVMAAASDKFLKGGK
jgi:uncharacterized protein